ncbi:transcriptional regulator [Comamonas serinivorans]|uniref:Transcriptional regulator n=1 Tax=Comamonas serinivorans TaxID=1082851 RepID=A0A1Y0EMV4_9BURK|nr:DJ-1/PfpI family protein [Comamonas serinivorans]ARU04781.1 transcriptional regulator [Comamonas serinivorans]
MNTRWLIGGAAVLALAALALGCWLFSLPATRAARSDGPPIPQAETMALRQALAPAPHSGRARPLIAVVGLNDATETTDYLMPTGILRRADVADVVMLATGPGPVQLYPALRVMPDATVQAFDTAHPDGADYVIVPAMSRDDDPAVMAWLRGQARKGARIIGICAGAKVVAAAGLLDGKRATTHWFFRRDLQAQHPSIHYVADRRLVADAGVTTTTGITASMPMMLALVDAIAGPDKAQALARDLGHAPWDTRHDSGAFRLTRDFAQTVMRNRLALWRHERLGVALASGMDEVSLALAADAWSRTYRSRVTSFAAASQAVTSRHGVRIVPDQVTNDWPAERRISTYPDQPPQRSLDLTLQAIGERHGRRTTEVVAMQLEYPLPAATRQP